LEFLWIERRGEGAGERIEIKNPRSLRIESVREALRACEHLENIADILMPHDEQNAVARGASQCMGRLIVGRGDMRGGIESGRAY